MVDGTSLSLPIFASVVALVNDTLLARREAATRLHERLLYAKGFEAFKDVTRDSSQGRNTTSSQPPRAGMPPAASAHL